MLTMKNMITGSTDGWTILVVNAADGPIPNKRAHSFSNQVGVPAIAVFLNKIDTVKDKVSRSC